MTQSKFFRQIRQHLIVHKKVVEVLVRMASSIATCAIWRTPVPLIEGVIRSIDDVFIDDIRNSQEYFNKRNGWYPLFEDVLEGACLYQLFIDVLNKQPNQLLPLTVGWNNNSSAKVIDVLNTQLGLEIAETKLNTNIYYRPSEIDRQTVIDFLVEEKKKLISSQYLSVKTQINDSDANISLHAEPLDIIQSTLADKYTTYVQNSFDNNINRSLCFYGQPGTGKTVLANTLVSNLNLRTLKIRNNSEYDDLNVLTEIIKLFDIQAVIINDFDQCDDSNKMLEFIEFLSAHCKLVIATVNSLKNFHPALLRPGRFDEIIKVDRLERNVVSDLLGDLSDEYIERCKNWPVAFLNELVKKSKLIPEHQLPSVYRDLNSRVKKQTEMLKEKVDDPR